MAGWATGLPVPVIRMSIQVESARETMLSYKDRLAVVFWYNLGRIRFFCSDIGYDVYIDKILPSTTLKRGLFLSRVSYDPIGPAFYSQSQFGGSSRVI